MLGIYQSQASISGELPNRSLRIDKSAENAWDLSIPSEHFGRTSDLLNFADCPELSSGNDLRLF